MTSSESQPRTPPPPGTVRWTFKPGTVRLIEHDGFTEVLFPEAEAASRPLDVERLARALRNAELSMRDERGRYRNRTPAYWRDVAELLFAMLPGLSGKEAP